MARALAGQVPLCQDHDVPWPPDWECAIQHARQNNEQPWHHATLALSEGFELPTPDDEQSAHDPVKAERLLQNIEAVRFEFGPHIIGGVALSRMGGIDGSPAASA